ncbi:hypothetical protein NC653_021320 [Populus alba x Populus x berolinensis]|uniref:Uncharacterized protein n=1 Tax=Populus alba x Populus x berolinensis TaxID=444605 RepID=A0AAD6QEW3_9ROSI|nr:hypothetical protein NC653_021320 [Populus alba x Populus x berolinensis]
MDYERIEKPQGGGGGLSPGKLRSMLLGVEKKRNQQEQEEELESSYACRSQLNHLDETGWEDACFFILVMSTSVICFPFLFIFRAGEIGVKFDHTLTKTRNKRNVIFNQTRP